MFVVPDGGGECEQALKYACGDAGEAAGCVSFEVELGFEGLVDRLDDLAEGTQEALPGPGWFVLVGGSDEGGTVVAEHGFEFDGSVALVGDDRLTV